MATFPHRACVLVAVSLVALSACRESDYYCPGAPDNNCNNSINAPDAAGAADAADAADAPPDAPECANDTQCGGPKPACEPDTMTCVQCTASNPGACVATTPVCNQDNTCQACSAHTDCLSNACLPDGACGDDANVAYVDQQGSDNDACTKATPCTRVDNALETNRAYVKFHGVIDEAVLIEGGRTVTFLADPGAGLTRSNGSGAIVTLRDDGTSLTVHDLTISNAPNNTSGFGCLIPAGLGAPSLSLTRASVMNNPGGGISIANGTLTVTRSTLSGNQGGGITATGGALTVTQSTLSGNPGGGISVSGANVAFDITNAFVFRNGDSNASTFGGVNLGIAIAGSNRFAFNTIVDNEAAINGGGIICNVGTFLAPNNIIARNSLAGSTTGVGAQTFGACTYPTSRIQADVSGLGFEDPDVPAPFSYRLLAGSTAIDQATTAVAIDVDNEGDSRPQGLQKDIGADERK